MLIRDQVDTPSQSGRLDALFCRPRLSRATPEPADGHPTGPPAITVVLALILSIFLLIIIT